MNEKIQFSIYPLFVAARVVKETPWDRNEANRWNIPKILLTTFAYTFLPCLKFISWFLSAHRHRYFLLFTLNGYLIFTLYFKAYSVHLLSWESRSPLCCLLLLAYDILLDLNLMSRSVSLLLFFRHFEKWNFSLIYFTPLLHFFSIYVVLYTMLMINKR